MKQSNAIVISGSFFGAEIEPGTFHGADIEPGTFHGADIEPGTFHSEASGNNGPQPFGTPVPPVKTDDTPEDETNTEGPGESTS